MDYETYALILMAAFFAQFIELFPGRVLNHLQNIFWKQKFSTLQSNIKLLYPFDFHWKFTTAMQSLAMKTKQEIHMVYLTQHYDWQ